MEKDNGEVCEVIVMEEPKVTSVSERPVRPERPERPARPERPERPASEKTRPLKPMRPMPRVPSAEKAQTTSSNDTPDSNTCVINVAEGSCNSNSEDVSAQLNSTEGEGKDQLKSEGGSTISETSATNSINSNISSIGGGSRMSTIGNGNMKRTVFLFGLMGEGKSCFANMLQDRDEEKGKQAGELFAVHAGQAEGTTRYQVEEVVSLDGEEMKVIDLPGVNQTKMKPNSKETLFWSELSEVFTAVPEGFDAAVLTIRSSNRLTEEALLFWDLFFTDNFGYSIWNRVILVLTFGDEIMSSFAHKSAYLKSCASENSAFGKLLNKVNNRCIVVPSSSSHARVHIQDFLTQLEKVRVLNNFRKYSEVDFRRCQKMQWSNRAQLARDQQKLLQESEERKQQYDKAINHLNQLRAKELELHANIIAQAFGSNMATNSSPNANGYRSFSDQTIRQSTAQVSGVNRSPSDFVQAQQSPHVDITPHEWMVNLTTHDELMRQDLNNKLQQRQQQQNQILHLHQMNTRRQNFLESTELTNPISLSPIPIADDQFQQQHPENAPPPSPKKKNDNRMKKAFRTFSKVIKR